MTYKYYLNGQPIDQLTPEQKRKLTDNLIAAIPGAAVHEEGESEQEQSKTD